MTRRPGRPPLDRSDPTVRFCISVTTKKYDELYARASASRMTLSEYIRHQLKATPAARRPNSDP